MSTSQISGATVFNISVLFIKIKLLPNLNFLTQIKNWCVRTDNSGSVPKDSAEGSEFPGHLKPVSLVSRDAISG